MPAGYVWEGARHVYTTTVQSGRPGMNMNLVAVPSDALDLNDEPLTLTSVARALQLEILTELPDPANSFVPHAIGAALAESDPVKASDLLKTLLSDVANAAAVLGDEVYSFAMHCWQEPLVGIEESRMRSRVLAAIIAASASVAVAAMAAITAPVLVVVAVGVGVGAGTVIVLSTAAAIGERIYDAIAPS